MNNITLGILLGIAAGSIDVVPMILRRLPWEANISAFCLWVAAGFMIATSSLQIHPVLKGLLISFLILLPSAILIGWQEPISLVPIIVMTLLLGSALGYLIERFGEQKG